MWVRCVLVVSVWAARALADEGSSRLVHTAQGPVKGYLDPEGGLFAFYGIPYATAPTGNDRFKAPLPGPVWTSTFDAVNKEITCLQPYPLQDHMQEDCLHANIFVPDTEKTNLSVVVIVHSGRTRGYANMFTPKNLVRSKRIIAVTFNYRLGALGFLCLGTPYIPGNAAMKDQVAALRWVQNNIASFGGNPNDVTIYGYDTGADAVDLLVLSKTTKGLFHRAILDSGSGLATSSVQIDPFSNARDALIDSGFGTFVHEMKPYGNPSVHSLENFFKAVSIEDLISIIQVKEGKDHYFGLSACVERDTGVERFLEDSPINILKKGDYNKVPMLYGFNNMEGLNTAGLGFREYAYDMNHDFSDFLPFNLYFSDDTERGKVAKKVKEFYFGEKKVGSETLTQYVNFFSDVRFTYPILRAIKLQVEAGNDNVYLYEYAFPRELLVFVLQDLFSSPVKVRGANRFAQTNAVLDTIPSLYNRHSGNETAEGIENYKKMQTIVRQLWLNFMTTGEPVPAGSESPAWPPTGPRGAPYMSLTLPPQLQHQEPLAARVRFWEDLYSRYYNAPKPPPEPPITTTTPAASSTTSATSTSTSPSFATMFAATTILGAAMTSTDVTTEK